MWWAFAPQPLFIRSVGWQYIFYSSFLNHFCFSIVWGFGLAAVATISLISLFMIIPLLKTTFYRKFLVFLIALAIGTLIGDSMFHLLPRVSTETFRFVSNIFA